MRHPGLVLRGGTRRAQCQDLQPGADPAGGLPEGGGGAGEILLPALSAPVSGVPVPGDPGSAPSVRRDALLLRTPPRGEPPPGSGGRAGRHPVPAGLRGLSAVSTRKNLRLSGKIKNISGQTEPHLLEYPGESKKAGCSQQGTRRLQEEKET